MADFMHWKGSGYDVVLCSQVLEHVPQPSSFLQKLLGTGKWVVVSVPYRWKDYGSKWHVWHDVTLKQVKGWAGSTSKPLSYRISREHDGTKRLIVVFPGTA